MWPSEDEDLQRSHLPGWLLRSIGLNMKNRSRKLIVPSNSTTHTLATILIPGQASRLHKFGAFLYLRTPFPDKPVDSTLDKAGFINTRRSAGITNNRLTYTGSIIIIEPGRGNAWWVGIALESIKQRRIQ
ncbi:hypothetical protein AB833_31980 [Chromatiales bacterium (ex Bugula neritina AB1)]|nr:hypothetical protein AB833_31980 [Chromatiales bacterium (ex Bugula neritina AB1)]